MARRSLNATSKARPRPSSSRPRRTCRPSRCRAGPGGQPVKVFHGKYFKPADLRPLNDLGDGGKITVWGDVFATEIKGSRRKIYFTSITDYTGSVNVKMIGDDGADMSKWESIKPGHHLHRPRRLQLRQVRARLRAVPLRHPAGGAQGRGRIPRPKASAGWSCTCIPRSSAMDGFCDPGKIVRLAHSMATGPSPSPTTASARATRRPCWPPTTSTKRTPASS